jgi:hypothetical protein
MLKIRIRRPYYDTFRLRIRRIQVEQCTFSGFEPQTRVFGYTPAAKGRTHGSLDAANVFSLAAVGITWILRVEGWTSEALSESGVLHGLYSDSVFFLRDSSHREFFL